METIMEMIIILLIIMLILLLLLFVICYNNNLYNIIFNRKKRNFWKFIIKNVDKFEFTHETALGKLFVWGDYKAVIWYDNTCSIHINNECILSSFDKVMSKRMYNLLLDKVK